MKFGREFGVLFDEKHSYKDFGLILNEKCIGTPKPQTNYVEVPLRDGPIDLTESLVKDVKYRERQIKMTFYYPGSMDEWSEKFSELQNMLHGKKKKLIFDYHFDYHKPNIYDVLCEILQNLGSYIKPLKCKKP